MNTELYFDDRQYILSYLKEVECDSVAVYQMKTKVLTSILAYYKNHTARQTLEAFGIPYSYEMAHSLYQISKERKKNKSKKIQLSNEMIEFYKTHTAKETLFFFDMPYSKGYINALNKSFNKQMGRGGQRKNSGKKPKKKLAK